MKALFDELDSLGKARSVAKLMFEPRNLRPDDGVRVIRGIRQFRHGDAEQPVEARWLEMNGEVVDISTDRQTSTSVRLGTYHGDTRRGVAVLRPRAMDTVSVCEERTSGVASPVQAAGNERDGVDLPVVMPYAQTYGRNTALDGAIFV